MRSTDNTSVMVGPRVEPLYWAIRALPLLGLIYHMVVSTPSVLGRLEWWAYLVAFAVVLGVPAPVIRWRRFQLRNFFWPICIADVLAVTALIYLSGGIKSNFFVLYYALVPYAAYTAGTRTGLVLSGGVTALYAAACFLLGGIEILPDFILRTVMMWIFAGTLGSASGLFGLFSQRLLNALDKLNERTSELERSNSQLQTIYETSRSLAELMPIDTVVDRILAIARQVLRFPLCEVYTWDPINRKLWLKGRMTGELTERLERPIPAEPDDVFRRAVSGQEVVRVADRHMGRAVIDAYPYRSQLVVPMMSEGKLIGLLSAQSPLPDAFNERDERVLSILASSSAMALVNADLHQQMEKLTIVDELTGLYNFRYFRGRIEEEERRAARYHTPLSLIMVDIDWFKGLNDRFGHQIGNVVLRQIAQIIGTCVRDVDVVARYGGEEFVVILPQTGTDEARRIAERMRRKVEQTELGPDSTGRPITVTISAGISCYPDNGLPEDNLIESVDQALYRAKGGGKNLVCTA